MVANRGADHAVSYETRDGRAYIVLRRPEKRNALTYAMLQRIVELIRLAEDDDSVRVVLLKGEGQDFCAGQDLTEVRSAYSRPSAGGEAPSQRARLQFDRRRLEQFRSLFYAAKPTIALVHGHCLGAGLSLVESTDLAVATDDAVLGHPEQRGNLAGAAYLTSWLMLTLGARKAREMLLLANSVSGAEAARIGLVNCAVAPGELESVGEAWAERVVGLPRDAIAVGKAATHLALDSLGMTSQFVHGYLTHTLSTHVHREADEIDTVPARFISRRNVR